MKRPGRMAWCAAHKTSVRFIISNGKSFKAESTTSRQAPQLKPQLQDVERGAQSSPPREGEERTQKTEAPCSADIYQASLRNTPSSPPHTPSPTPTPLPLSAAADAIKTYHGTKPSAFLLNAPPLSARRCTPPPSIPAARPGCLWVR